MAQLSEKFTLSNPPPRGHPQVAIFANSLFDIALAEKRRLGKNQDFLSNYALYRGRSADSATAVGPSTPVNLYFANIERTVANVTARQPVGEVIDLDGIDDGGEEVLTVKLKKWWKATHQQRKTCTTARTMEVYGITPEKALWNKDKSEPDIQITDPFAFVPAPGNYENFDEEAPFVCFLYLDFVDKVEKDFKVKGVAPDDGYELLGQVREEYSTPACGGLRQTVGNYADPMIRSRHGVDVSDKRVERCLIKEVWIRDFRTHRVVEESPVINEESGFQAIDEHGMPLFEKFTRQAQIYPDGVRKITIVQSMEPSVTNGYIVLDDSANPNINPALELELAMSTYPWGRFPCYYANSYPDLVTTWGFSAAEQVGDLIVKINQIISKLTNYVIQVMAPPLIVQKHCGISRELIETSLSKPGRLLLMPSTPNARIEFLQIPNLPATFFQTLELIVKFFDRVYQIEDADRGEAPKGVIAASAIVALQERNQVLMQSKTTSIDSLVEQRSRWAIGLWQNFGTTMELVEVADEPTEFVGTRYAGRQFSYVVEAGSTSPRTSLQTQEQAVELYKLKAIDIRALLETLKFPGWVEIVERMGETQLDQALQVLIDAGLPEDEAIELKQYLMQPGQLSASPTGKSTPPARKTTESKTAKTGKPKAEQRPQAER